MSVYSAKLTTRANLALVVIFTGLMLASIVSSLPAAAAASPSNVHTEAVIPIQNFQLTEWTVPTAASGPYGVGVDTNGKVWFTENNTNKRKIKQHIILLLCRNILEVQLKFSISSEITYLA